MASPSTTPPPLAASELRRRHRSLDSASVLGSTESMNGNGSPYSRSASSALLDGEDVYVDADDGRSSAAGAAAAAKQAGGGGRRRKPPASTGSASTHLWPLAIGFVPTVLSILFGGGDVFTEIMIGLLGIYLLYKCLRGAPPTPRAPTLAESTLERVPRLT